jgi:hypothetical protein
MATVRPRAGAGLKVLVGASLACASLLAGCGGTSSPPVGSSVPPPQPVAARPTPAGSNPDIGKAAVQSTPRRTQSVVSSSRVQKGRRSRTRAIDEGSAPRVQFNPCTLVRRPEAEAILRGPIASVVEAPLGPTCIYTLAASKKDITVAVEEVGIAQARNQMRKPNVVHVRGRQAYCGRLGNPMLFAPVADGRVLNVTAPCAVARRFAAVALGRLGA